jgi:hypothetical protein
MPLLFYYPFALTPLLFYYPFVVFTGMLKVTQDEIRDLVSDPMQ